MSVYAFRWAMAQNIRSEAQAQHVRAGALKLLLLDLGWHTSKGEGKCHPSLNRLSEDTGLSVKWVENNLELLQKMDLIEIFPRYSKNGGRISNGYLLKFDAQ